MSCGRTDLFIICKEPYLPITAGYTVERFDIKKNSYYILKYISILMEQEKN